MIRVLVIAPYTATRAGLRALLASAADMDVAGEAADEEGAIQILERISPDVWLVDYSPLMGARLVELARAEEIPLVVLGDDREGYRPLAESFPRGWGFLLKDAEGGEIAGAIRAAVSGVAALDVGIAHDLAVSGSRLSAAADPAVELTVRENEVLQLLAAGLPNKTIAAKLGISQHTVKFHVAAILSKLGASSRTEAVTFGARAGLITF